MQHYLDILEATYMLRRLPPIHANLGKRLVKSPKIYLRDSGLLHSLLDITTLDDLAGHPIVGASWEGWALEQVTQLLGPSWQFSFYRTAVGAELDIVAERGKRKIGFEIKFSSAPMLTKGFWQAVSDLKPDHTYIIAPIKESYPITSNVTAIPAVNLAGIAKAIRRVDVAE